MKDDPCKKFSHYDKDGKPVYVEKRIYETDKEAIEVARQMNTNDAGPEVKACLEYSQKLAFNNPEITKEECLVHVKNYKIPVK